MKLIHVFGLAAVLYGCSAENEVTMVSKLDAPLRQRIAWLSATASEETLSVFLKCNDQLDETSRGTLHDAGARIVSETGRIVSAQVSSQHIMKLAALHFVSSVQLSQELNVLFK